MVFVQCELCVVPNNRTPPIAAELQQSRTGLEFPRATFFEPIRVIVVLDIEKV
jgi:hypothetical protein